MTIRLKRVDGGCARYSALLTWLQLEALPQDIPTSTDEGWWWVAFEGDQPVAFAGLYESSTGPTVGYLCRAGVLPCARGKGLQRALIRVREKHARKLGMTHMRSDTYNNPHSTNNLIALGYRAYESAVPYGAVGTNYWLKAL